MLNGRNNHIAIILLLTEGSTLAMSTTRHSVQSLGLHTELDNIAIRNRSKVNKGSQRAGHISRKHGINSGVQNGKVGPTNHRISCPSISVLYTALHARNLLNLGKVSALNLICLSTQGNALLISAQLAIVLNCALMKVIVLELLIESSVTRSKSNNFRGKISHIQKSPFLIKCKSDKSIRYYQLRSHLRIQVGTIS